MLQWVGGCKRIGGGYSLITYHTQNTQNFQSVGQARSVPSDLPLLPGELLNFSGE